MKWGLTSLTSVAWNAGARVVVNGVVTGSPKQTWRRYALVDVGLAMDTYTNTHTHTKVSSMTSRVMMLLLFVTHL